MIFYEFYEQFEMLNILVLEEEELAAIPNLVDCVCALIIRLLLIFINFFYIIRGF